LLEAAVFGARAGRAATSNVSAQTPVLPIKAYPDLNDEAMQTLRLAMDRDAGVVRDAAGLTRLLALIDALEDRHGQALPLVAARLVAASALQRTESRGGHSRSDFPETDLIARHTYTSLAQVLARRPVCVAAE
jgi:L-aspartate oxidase